jgi:hypothetical protein
MNTLVAYCTLEHIFSNRLSAGVGRGKSLYEVTSGHPCTSNVDRFDRPIETIHFSENSDVK